jgi:N-acetylglucosaminyldiphosphoundecaprenol N-acetyl-beta-D-mannosaminyltransferase
MAARVKDGGKKNLLGVLIDSVDYEAAVDRVTDAVEGQQQWAGTALAVHGVMEGVKSPTYRYRLNALDLVTPDGQPVRWFVNFLYRAGLTERVYGPTLMGKLCAKAAAAAWPVYLYGSTPAVLRALSDSLVRKWPDLKIAGTEASKFKVVTRAGQEEIAARIRESKARLCFVGLGCPRQEIFVHEMKPLAPCPMLAVGAAFDFHAGLSKEPPHFVQRAGLQWLHRLMQEPRRLWRRYVLLNPWFLFLAGLQLARIYRPSPLDVEEPSESLFPA